MIPCSGVLCKMRLQIRPAVAVQLILNGLGAFIAHHAGDAGASALR